MNRKSLKLSPLVFLIVAASSSAILFVPGPVFANPPCGAVLLASTTLTASIGTCPGPGLTIGANGITLNCAGFAIFGSGVNNGITLPPGRTGVTIVNCTVDDFVNGFFLNGAVHNFVLNSKANGNKIGFGLVGSSYNTLYSDVASGQTPSGAPIGIYGFQSTGSKYNNFILDTGTRNTKDGFLFTSSLVNNILSSTGSLNGNYGFAFTATALRNYMSTNRGINNKLIGFFDSSVGAGTLGTDNFYSNNFASANGVKGSSPLMLGCPPLGTGPQC